MVTLDRIDTQKQIARHEREKLQTIETANKGRTAMQRNVGLTPPDFQPMSKMDVIDSRRVATVKSRPSRDVQIPTYNPSGNVNLANDQLNEVIDVSGVVDKSEGQIQWGDGSFSGTPDLRYAGPEIVSTVPLLVQISRYEWAMALRAPAIVPATYSCKFNWAPPNPPAASQKLYWDVVRGGRARAINLSGTTTNFNMKNLTNGQTYFVEVISVNSQGQESTNTCAGSFIWEFRK